MFKLKLLMAVACLCSLLLFAACVPDEQNNGKDNHNYPEGAIALNEQNFTDYFKIKTTASCDYNFYVEQTEAVAYVAIIPLFDYKEVVGEIKFDVNTRVYKWFGNGFDFKIVNEEQSLLLDEGIVNESYRMYIQEGSETGSDPYRIKNESIGVTVNSLHGYIILEQNIELNQIEQLTEEQKQNSTLIFDELNGLLGAFKLSYEQASSYSYYKKTSYSLFSYYGEDFTKSSNPFPTDYDIDIANERFERDGNKRYYSVDGNWYEQILEQDIGLVRTGKSGFDMQVALEQTMPNWQVLDDGAIYVKGNNDGEYFAYVTLIDMKEGALKDRILNSFKSHGVTTKYDRFVVKYSYFINQESFDFNVNINYTDFRYNVQYYDIRFNTEQKISNLNNAEVNLYTHGNYDFMLCDKFEDAQLFKNGLTEVDGSTSQIVYKTYGDGYRDEQYPPQENYLPIRILEGGVYNFTPDIKTVTILDENGKVYGHYDKNNYFEPGLYYIRYNYVSYGITTVNLTVTSRIYKDYGNLYSPTQQLLDDDNFECVFEGNGDLNTFTFVPENSGLYNFGSHENVRLTVYNKKDMQSAVADAWAPNHNVQLEKGEEYVLAFECVNYGDKTDDFTYQGRIDFIGKVTPQNTLLTFEWQDVVLFEPAIFCVNLQKVGRYYVEYQWVKGADCTDTFFYDENGKSYYVYENIEQNGTQVKVYALNAANYTCQPSINYGEYFVGKVRLVCYEEGVTEITQVELLSTGYKTLTTSNLNVIYSTSSFTFTVTQKSRLLITENSDFFAVYDSNGRKYGITTYPTYTDNEFNGIQTKYVNNLQAGTYTIVFEIDSYTTPGVKSATVRLMFL